MDLELHTRYHLVHADLGLIQGIAALLNRRPAIEVSCIHGPPMEIVHVH